MSRIKHRLQKLRHYYVALGLKGVLVFIWAKVTGTKPALKTRVQGARHPICVRIGTTDTSVLRQVFKERQYDIPIEVNPKLIIDAGANIGLASVFFANKYPNALIIAVEPEPSNFKILQRNVSAYPQIQALQAAVWNEDGQICLYDPGDGHHGFQTAASAESGAKSLGSVEAVTIGSLIARAGTDRLDILKIDIEGAEKVVFAASPRWLDAVDVIMAELHDHIHEGCSKVFFEATGQFQIQIVNGETVVRARRAGIT